MQQSIRASSILAACAAFLPACYVVAPPPPVAPAAPAEAPAVPPVAAGTPLEAAPPVGGRPLNVRTFEQASPPAPHPSARADVPPGYFVLGGGCRSEWRGDGQLLTASIPDGHGWRCAAKDHGTSDPAPLSAFAIAMPADARLDPRVVTATGASAAHPTARVAAPPGYALIGGGCRSNWEGGRQGNLLTGSYPAGQEWVCDAKDHELSSPATLTAFAVVVRADLVDVRVTTRAGDLAQHPTARAVVEDGYALVGGGCSDQYTEPGNMLWASYPDPAGNAWVCAGKDHHLVSPARVSAFAIGVRRRHAR